MIKGGDNKMKRLANTVLVIGVISMIVGIVVRLLVKPIVLGHGPGPASILNFSIACFLLTIALNSMQK